MPLHIADFALLCTFAGLPRGGLFRFEGLPFDQIALKAEGPDSEDAVLVLGSVTGGPYPAPWIGPMADIEHDRLFAPARAHTVHPVLLDTPIGKDAIALPGDLLRDAKGRYSVFIEDHLAIDLATGRRRRVRFDSDRVHKAWSMHWADETFERPFFLFPTPGTVARRDVQPG